MYLRRRISDFFKRFRRKNANSAPQVFCKIGLVIRRNFFRPRLNAAAKVLLALYVLLCGAQAIARSQQPGGFEQICSSSGASKLVLHLDGERTSANPAHFCPLCTLGGAAPPPALASAIAGDATVASRFTSEQNTPPPKSPARSRPPATGPPSSTLALSGSARPHSFLDFTMRNALFTAIAVISHIAGSPTHAQTAEPNAPTYAPTDAPTKQIGIITVTSERPSSLPTQIPTTILGVTGAQIENTINATDSEDALKYFPSLLVRKRYIGDYDHAVLASRASGTGNSARSLVFADGILLSNLLGNGASFTPRWGAVTPEEIERVDVLYGPFSAAYSGNSVGAVVDYVTKMPKQFEAHAKLSGFTQSFDQYGSHGRYSGAQASASLGDRAGPWTWWVNVSRVQSDAQPISFANKLVSTGGAANATPVTGAISGQSQFGKDWWLLGETGQTNTNQDHAKLKIRFDIAPQVRAHYTLGWWHNDTIRNAQTYLQDASGNPFYAGVARIDGKTYTVAPTDIAASWYDYQRDQVRAPTVAFPASQSAGAGRLTDQHGTGWNTLAARGVWRPDAAGGGHVVEFGVARDAFQLRTQVSNLDDWIGGAATSRVSGFQGNTQLQSLYVQDTWRAHEQFTAVAGLRAERWLASDGALANATTQVSFAPRSGTFVSPKLALGYGFAPEATIKLSTGKAVRFPTVSELYQGTIATNIIVNNDPNLKPEQSWTTELSVEKTFGESSLRVTAFQERTRDALYSQTNTTVTPNVTNIQNIDRLSTNGLEVAAHWHDALWIKGLGLTSSLTYADSTIDRNDKFPASVGKRQPRVPKWRGNLLLAYAANAQTNVSLGLRYSGEQFGTLDNTDINPRAYFGFSPFFVADVRVRYAATKQWSFSLGIDNVNNEKYWAFHPYPQRTFLGEMKYAY
jgi:iron complex outermembrane recepter protein